MDGKRTITLRAGADQTTNAQTLLKAFTERTQDYQDHLPVGYEFTIGGVNEENAKSVQSLMIAMMGGLILIVGTIVLQFNSYKQSLLVLVPIPLSLIGVFIGLTLANVTLSFPSLIGLVALF